MPTIAHLNSVVNASSSNALQVLCAFPISGFYGKLTRPLIYPLFLMSLASNTSLVALMTYCAVAAVHLTAMAAIGARERAVDLDMVPAYFLTMLGLTASPPYLMWSKRLRKPPGHLIFVAWMITLWVGAVSYTAVARSLPFSVPCLDAHGNNVSSPKRLDLCALKYGNLTLEMRPNQSAQVVQAPNAYIYSHKTLTIILVIITVFAFYGIANAGTKSPYEQVKERRWKHRDPFERQQFMKDRSSPRKASITLVVASLIAMEVSLSHLPHQMGNMAVERWTPIVALGMVTAASLLTYFCGEDSDVPSKTTCAESEHRPHADRSTEAGSGQAQESISCQDRGVVEQSSPEKSEVESTSERRSGDALATTTSIAANDSPSTMGQHVSDKDKQARSPNFGKYCLTHGLPTQSAGHCCAQVRANDNS